MTAPQRLFIVVLALTAIAVTAPQAWASYNVVAHCQSGGQLVSCDGWHTSPIQLSWTWTPTDTSTGDQGCKTQSFGSNTAITVTCNVSGQSGNGGTPQAIDVEISNPTATATLARPPDSNGWYNHPVGVFFQGGGFSGSASCVGQSSFAGPDQIGATVGGSCTDPAGKTVGVSVRLNYDATPPTITAATPSRSADFNGWYNHPVAFAFAGTDSVAGIEGCSTVTYAGPPSANASVVGSCTDRAGNVASLTVPFRYDATPPALSARADIGDGSVTLHWQKSPDVTLVSISRSPGQNGSQESVIARAGSGTFVDKHVRNGVRYRYTIVCRDQAGNTSSRTVLARPGLRLLSPISGAKVSSAPLLRWTYARRATYYNIQIYRGGKKVFSYWPKRASLQLPRSWHFAGRRYRLRPGLYRWYVWPGFGPPAAARYGSAIGSSTFVVKPTRA